ncbi:hypothetical protein DdX_20454 [Ditylenchus destructor]|uniref:Uncharacterized protein n=1 Tax=Ditylenchus destructor TaxID=166010 RepID=A0AAD4QWI5_9BILA|nr:hypothetical protein DdX_20454 [Ditylenchus destructor]
MNSDSGENPFTRTKTPIDERTLLGADHQEPGDETGDEHRGQVDDAAVIGAAHQRVGRSARPSRRSYGGRRSRRRAPLPPFRIAERCDCADHAGDHERQHHAGAGLLRRFGGENENAGADHRADAEHGELETLPRTVERFLFGGG